MPSRASTKRQRHDATHESAPRLVYTQAPVLLGRVIERTEDGWRVDLGAVERTMPLDPAVDPALVEEAIATGARVLIDAAGTGAIVGVIATQRAVSIDREGRVDAEVKSLEIRAEEHVVLTIPGAFVRAKAREVEVYGERVVTRARNLVKILSAMIKLN